MASPMRSEFDALGLEVPFAEALEDESRFYAGPSSGELESPFAEDRVNGEELAWLDLESPGADGAWMGRPAYESEWFEPENSEAGWNELSASEEEGAFEVYRPGWSERSPWGESAATESLYARENERAATDVATLEGLLENEAGPGTSLADRVKGVASFVLGPTLGRGDSGAGVATLQRTLVTLGYDLAVDGSFGPNTESAVRTFQSRSGLTADGVVGPQTKAALAAAVGKRSVLPPSPPGPAPTPPAPAPTPADRESLDDFITRLANEWSRRANGKLDAAMKRESLRRDYEDTLTGARLRYGRRFVEDAVRRAWMISREEQMRFATERAANVKPLVGFEPPSYTVALTSDKGIIESDKAPVAPIMVRFVEELRRRYAAPLSVSNYVNHGGGKFRNRGYSLDLELRGRDDRGFYPRQSAIDFLRAVNEAAAALQAQWRIIYNDFAVANAINTETGRANVIFVGDPTRSKTQQVTGLNWHGPAPLILHFHLDLVPSAGSPDREWEDGTSGEAFYAGVGARELFSQREGPTGLLATFERYIDSETSGTGLADRLKEVATLVFGPTMQRGSSGDAVATLQRALAALGSSIGVDGAFGPNTERAVREFQARRGLTADGVVGPATKAALVAALGGRPAPVPPAPSPTPSRDDGQWKTYTNLPSEIGVRTTTLSTAEVATLVRKHWPEITEQGVRTLVAQWAAETNFGKSCFSYNFGNVKCVDPKQGHMYLKGVWEIAKSDGEADRMRAAGGKDADDGFKKSKGVSLSTRVVLFEPTHPASRFRAFRTADDGMAFWLGFKKQIAAKYLEYLPALNRGDIPAVAHVLAKARYATTSEAAYRAGMMRARQVIEGQLGPIA
ncbi:hypothetical protein AKJ09_06183 [Labilithrix luteola]|uniref:Peptidoglycan binding-like domain-containing protein n=1 Tax=Labilithrix luteola TaxID=1391654 RepID=A0A0K1Q2A7_9BACT|nr:peptidoglycan-binding domain-containing protein [Labilithrix luteola]AKU99519.1 hypothetical protein AKJ09_06183 [Labilithrix luteola]